MTFEEKQIEAIKGATSDMQELNTKLDIILPSYLERSVRALILREHLQHNEDNVYKYLCTNYDLINMSFREMIAVIEDIERCHNIDCREWNKSEDLEHSIHYGGRVCPECIRSI
jgi:hypothetical protein